jgi:type II secretory pathway pseudopilin PulG
MQLHSQPEMVSVFNELETSRLHIARQHTRAYWSMGIGVLCLLSGFLFGLIEVGLVLFIIGLITGFVLLGIVSNKTSSYKLDFKLKVIGTALRQLDDNLQMNPQSGISERDFMDSHLFSQTPDRYKTEDLVYGVVDKTQIHFAEVHAQHKTETSTKNGKQTHWHDIFKGIIFCADFNKNFNGITVIKPKGFGGAFGKWVSQNVFNNKNIVELENVDFDKMFITESGDQVEARYILTPSLMEKLLALNEYANSTISVSFIWSNVYIAFPLNHNYFEAPIFKSLLNADILEKDLNVLRLMRHVVEDLDLNTRIWTKQ